MLNAFLSGFSGMAGIAAALTFIGDHQQAIEWIRDNMHLPPRANHRAGHVFLLGLCLSASSISAILVMDTLGPERYIFPMDQPIYNWNGTVYQRALSLGVGIPVATMSFYYSALLVACIVHHQMESQLFENFLEKLIFEINAVADGKERLFVVLGLGARFAGVVNKRLAQMGKYYDNIYLWMRDVPSASNFREGLYEVLANAGIEREKIIVGLTPWARKYSSLGRKMGHGKWGAFEGMLPYTEICKIPIIQNTTYDPASSTTSFETADGLWISYNQPYHESWSKKIGWISRHIYGGIGLQNLEVDDSQGSCGQGSYPLHRSAWQYLVDSMRPAEEIKELKEWEKFVNEVNAMNGTWRAKFDAEMVITYNKIQGGSLWNDTELAFLPNGPNHNLHEIPSQFDARLKWPKCSTIGEVHNQGTCSSCWAVASSAVMSDRICITTGKVVSLSAGDIMRCCLECIKGDNGCIASKPKSAFKYYESTGIVSSQCLPYPIPPCNFNKQKRQPNLDYCGKTMLKPDPCKHQCLNPKQINWNSDKHSGGEVYTVHGPEEIQKEIIKNGPVLAGMDITQAFAVYESGLLPLPLGGSQKEAHAIKIIGWGKMMDNDETVNYWIGVNSFGRTWGEAGLVKIRWTAIRKFGMGSLPV